MKNLNTLKFAGAVTWLHFLNELFACDMLCILKNLSEFFKRGANEMNIEIVPFTDEHSSFFCPHCGGPVLLAPAPCAIILMSLPQGHENRATAKRSLFDVRRN